MILRVSSQVPARTFSPEPAWPVFEQVQSRISLPCSLVSQPAHARLAGSLARRLKAEAFGDLPGDVLDAIRLHDVGWEEVDEDQLRELDQDAAARPRSFLEIEPAIATAAWRRSIRHAESISPAAAIIVSRHFCSLAMDGEEHHRAFLNGETARRQPLEESCSSPAHLTQWLGALGFCDLLSLTLCSGHERPVTIPLAHPNMPEAKGAQQVTVEVEGETVRLLPAVLASGVPFTVEAQEQSRAGEPGRTAQLRWVVRE